MSYFDIEEFVLRSSNLASKPGESNRILGAIPNPGNSVSTLFGIPVGLQLGTAMGMKGMGALAVDILTDPLTYLSFGGTAAGKIGKAAKFLGGAKVADKMSDMNRVMHLAGLAKQSPELSKGIAAAASGGNVPEFTKLVRQLRGDVGKGVKRFHEVEKGVFTDLKKVMGEDGLQMLETAYKHQDSMADALEVGKKIEIQHIIDGKKGLFASPLPFGLGKEGTQISKFKFLNDAPKAKELIEQVEFRVLRGAQKAGEAIGPQAKRLASLAGIHPSSLYKHYAAGALAREMPSGDVIRTVTFLEPDDILRVANDFDAKGVDGAHEAFGHILGEKTSFKTPFGRIFSPVVDTLDSMGDAGKQLAGAMQSIRRNSEDMFSGQMNQFAKIFGDDNIYAKPLLRKMSIFGVKDNAGASTKWGVFSQEQGAKGLQDVAGFGKNQYDDQVRTLTSFLDTGKWLHERDDVVDLIVRGKKTPTAGFAKPTDGTQWAAKQMREMLNDTAARSEALGIKVVNHAGETDDFARIAHFFPRQHGDNFATKSVEGLRDSIAQSIPKPLVEGQGVARYTGFSDLPPDIAKKVQAKADSIVADTVDGVAKKRFGSLDFHRHFDLPGWKGDPLSSTYKADDSLNALKQYFYGSNFRLERVATLGQEADEAKGLLVKILEEGGEAGLEQHDFAKKALNAFDGKHIFENQSQFQLVGAINAVQVANKLAFPSAFLTNLGQSNNTVLATGVHNSYKATRRAMSEIFKKETAFAERLGVTMSSILKEERGVENMFTRFADAWLDMTGFNRVERWNRRVAAYAGIEYGEEMAKKLLSKSAKDQRTARQAFKKMGLNSDDIINIRSAGGVFAMEKAAPELALDIQRKMAKHVVEATQFRTQVQDLPLWRSTAPGQFFGLFKSFALKQQDFMVKDVFRPAVDYAITNGKHGDIKPFARFAASAGLGGALMGELIIDTKRLFDSGERPDKLTDRWVENFAQVGGAGFITDIALSTSRFGERGFTGALGGPNLATAATAARNIFGGQTQNAADDITAFVSNNITPLRAEAKRLRKADKKKRREEEKARKLMAEVKHLRSIMGDDVAFTQEGQ